MELLIVIAVLGLLLGMLIPRLAGVTDDTVDTVCDTNNKGVRYFTQMYQNKYGSLPNGLTNLVNDDGASLPEMEDTFATSTDPDGDAEAMAWEFWSRNWPGLYALNADEVSELREMGIPQVYNLNDVDGRPMNKANLAEGMGVMMMGMEAADATSAPSWVNSVDENGDDSGLSVVSGDVALGNPHFLGRIMLAVNENCDLVKQGMIQASALCPGAVLHEENFTHKEYILVMPRLEATIDRLVDGSVIASESVDLVFVEDPTDTDSKQFEVTFEAQESWAFDMTCPEGHKWPDFDEDSWFYNSGL